MDLIYDIQQTIYCAIQWCSEHPVITIIVTLTALAASAIVMTLVQNAIEKRKERSLPPYLRRYY